MKIKILLSAISLVLAGLPCALRAQPSIEQLERTQREMQLQQPKMLNLSTNAEAPEMYPGENADVGPQRILRVKPPRRSWFEVVADSQYFYSDNAYLSDPNKVSTAILVNTIQAAFAPSAYDLWNGQFAPVIGYRSQWFNYDLGGSTPGLDRLNFNAQTAFLSLRYQREKWFYTFGFDFTRLLDQERYDEVYREYVPYIALQRTFPVNDNLLFSAGAQIGYHFTDIPQARLIIPVTNATSLVISPASDVNDRFDASLTLSMAWMIAPQLVLQPFYRFQYTYYAGFAQGHGIPEVGRSDYINSLGTTLTYYFTKNISARLFVNYEIKDSDFSKSVEYHKLDAGGGLSLDVRF